MVVCFLFRDFIFIISVSEMELNDLRTISKKFEWKATRTGVVDGFISYLEVKLIVNGSRLCKRPLYC